MERINPAKALSTQQPSEQPASSAQAKTATPAALTKLWLAAIGTWGAKWTAHCGELPVDDNGHLTLAGAMWAQGLGGFGEATILNAMAHFARIADEWPPNLPQVRKRCFGIPSFAEVNNEILTTTSDKRTAFARLVWSFIVDPYAYRHCSAKDAERLRRDAYEQACEHLMTGGGLPPEPAGAIEQDHAPRSLGIPKTREERIAHLRQVLGGDFSEVAVTVRNEDELRKHHATQDKRAAEQELLP